MTGPLPDFHTDPLFKGTDAKFLQHHICLNDFAVNLPQIRWCRDNCEGEWGWFFDPLYEHGMGEAESTAYMAFANTQDAIKFKLIII